MPGKCFGACASSRKLPAFDSACIRSSDESKLSECRRTGDVHRMVEVGNGRRGMWTTHIVTMGPATDIKNGLAAKRAYGNDDSSYDHTIILRKHTNTARYNVTIPNHTKHSKSSRQRSAT